MIRIFVISLAAVALASCNAGESQAKEAVKQSLKDPDSAKFGRFQEVISGSACVEVNAKNTYGGYTGDSTIAVKQVGSDGKWASMQEFEGRRGFPDCVIALAPDDESKQ